MTEYKNLFVSGPWYRRKDRYGNIFLDINPPDDVSPIKVEDLSLKYTDIIQESPIKITTPPNTIIRVPINRLSDIKTDLKNNGFIVSQLSN